MLRTLHIRDFVIVEQAEIHFGGGFTVFSGETGAGKSILIDALALALGERADAGVLREGAARADITAVFDTPPALRDWLAERELDAGDELALRRVVDVQGRSRGYINGMPATLAQLRELGDSLVDIHGQHAHQSLMRADAQRDMLDAHGGHGELRQAVAQAWKDWRALARQLELAEKDAAGLAAERERLQWQADELDRLALQADEWETLQAEQSRLAHAQALLDGAGQILEALDGEDDSAHHRINAAQHRLQQMLRHDPALQGVADELESARIAVAEAVSDLNNYVTRVELDPQRLAEVDARMSAVFETARKFKTEPDALPGLREALHAQLADMQAAADIDALRTRADAARAQYEAAAGKLSAARRKVAKSLGKQVTQAMQTLAMQGGSFEPAVSPAPPSAHGADQVEFLVAGHAGTTPRPLAKVASGGELARISLALSVIASRAARVPTLIFDEVDSGVGGAVAEVVGKLLRELGERHQVLCVTHLPQVAACGNAQYRVSKTETAGTTRSRIDELDAGQRVEEIARMLGGIKITATTREHAREMLGVLAD
ncbi:MULTISPECIES: DNA repair protein RecN [Bordetella]|uniref:DNA repair protein RecN n=2 Tax=Bordetella TaxID=517 RepID=A0A261W0K7_9BORD|nr:MULTISPECIES: DNA repair protein RecN [Bordetella]MDM9559835.1 DNA repair protein RecN [Bordetella petrii]OZI79272.1 DNA repair protein RecN [Bordetella genomosp. 2]